MEPKDGRAMLAVGALEAAKTREWREISLFDVADAAGVPVAALYPCTMADAPDVIEGRLDQAAAEGLVRSPPETSHRDRLFDVAMRRFEAMELHRAALIRMDDALARDPVAQAASHLRGVRTARWLMALAEIEGDGVAAAARAQGFAAVLRQARTAWRRDEEGDFARTMAALDKGLRQGEDWAGRLGLSPAPRKG